VADFPGIWMTESESMAYRVVPKAACSTIGQIMYFTDHGRFFDGDIHDATSGIHKWALEPSQPVIRATIEARRCFAFSAVRNPYARILSAFLDKICGIQRSGSRYRPDMAEKIRRAYGIETEGAFDQIAAFRRFLLLARDTIRWKKPFWPDIHWAPQANHIATLVRGGGRLDHVFHTEAFNAGMQVVLDRAPIRHAVDLATIPRFNESEGVGPKRAHPVSAYFDDLGHFMMRDTYRRDFRLFRYDIDDPDRAEPKGEIDLAEVHERLARPDP